MTPYARAIRFGYAIIEREVMNKATAAVIILALSLTAACKKKEPPAPAAPPPAPAPVAQPAAPAEPAKPLLALDGTPSENLVAVFSATVTELQGVTTAAEASEVIEESLKSYDVADLRAKSRAAKAAGQGASPATKAELSSLKDQYQKLATKFSAEDPAAFGKSAEAWAKAWGLN